MNGYFIVMKNIYCFNSPIGIIKIEDNGIAVTAVCIDKNFQGDFGTASSVSKIAEKQLKEYFCGKRRAFDLPIEPNGTEFQLKVWNALCQIPYGETRSYKEIAELIGSPKASRAVGGANNKNPIMIIIPCHRVIVADGSLIGYAGGIDTKEKLLELEKSNT